jgi:hypothetical protein
LKDVRPSVELLPEHLVGIDEAFEFTGQIIILAQKDSRVTVDGILLLELHVKVAAQVGVGVGHALNVSLDGIEVLILVLQVDVVGADNSRHVNIACLGLLNVLTEVIAVGAHAVDVFAECTNLNASRGVDVLQSGQFSLGLGESDLLVADFKGTSLNGFIAVSDKGDVPVEVEVEGLGAVILIERLLASHVEHVTQALHLTEHISTLRLDKVNVSLELSDLGAKINDLVSLDVGLVTELA